MLLTGFCRGNFLEIKHLKLIFDKKLAMTKYIYYSLFLFFTFLQNINAQVDSKSELYKTILAKDSLLFTIGFNTCDATQFEELMSDKLEFFHDKDGFSNKTKFINDFKTGLCKNPKLRQVKRSLVKESTKIYPLYKNNILYGAIQNGEHLFSEEHESQPGIAKFTNLWLLENNEWKLTKSYSFNHQAYDLKKSENTNLVIENKLEILQKKYNIKTLGLGIIENGKLKEIKVLGESSSYNSIFNVASLTKPITAMVALQLINLGKWKLDEPIYNYWTDPDVAKDPRNKKLTTRLILSHQTGFPNWRWQNENKKLNFEFEPGTKYQYSGEGYEYLRKALENKFKKSLEQLAKELIFVPLKMNDTSYIWSKNTDESRFVIGYNKNDQPYEIVKNKTANAADDLQTTIEDYGNFLVNILNGGNLNENIYKEMIAKQVKTKENKFFGLGLDIYDLGNNELALSHGGSDSGSQCIFILLPKTKQGLIIFTNSDEGYKIYEELLIEYLGEKGKKIVEIETK